MKSLFLGTLLLTFAISGQASEVNKAYTLKPAKVYEEKVSAQELQMVRDQLAEEVTLAKKSDNPLEDLDLVNVAIDKIFTIGEKIWKVIDANRPVVNLNTKRVSALPQGAENWLAMDGWSDLEARKMTIVYENLFGMEVAKLSYLITYTYGGSVDGRGKYLSQVGFVITELNVAWGFTFNAEAEVVRTQNVGTRQDPVAALELNLNWSVITPLKHHQKAVNFYLRGDGHVTARGL